MPYQVVTPELSFTVHATSLANYCFALDDTLQILESDQRTLLVILHSSRAEYLETHGGSEVPPLPTKYMSEVLRRDEVHVCLRGDSDDGLVIVTDSGHEVCSGSIAHAHPRASPLQVAALLRASIEHKLARIRVLEDRNQRYLDEIDFLKAGDVIELH